MSLTFEGDGLMPYEVNASLALFKHQVESYKETEKEEICSINDKAVNFFKVINAEDPLKLGRKMSKLSHSYPKAGHERKKESNREFHTIITCEINGDLEKELDVAIQQEKSILGNLLSVIQQRFQSFGDQIYKSMSIYDPKFWNIGEKSYGLNEIETIFNHFKEPLVSSGFNLKLAKNEWQSIKVLTKECYQNFNANQLWHTILTMREKEYPNMCKLVELIIAISGSNSSVERTFSILTLILSDRRLSLKHDGMEDLMMIAANDSLWSEKDKNDIYDRAYEIYSEKRRKVAFEDKVNFETGIQEPPLKKTRLDASECETSSSDTDDGSSESDDRSSESDNTVEDLL